MLRSTKTFMHFSYIVSVRTLVEHTLPLCVLREDSVANPFPQMLQWKGRFFSLSIWDSWFRRCCCRLDSWINARPQSGTWHLYGLSPEKRGKIRFQELNNTKFSCLLSRMKLAHFGKSSTIENVTVKYGNAFRKISTYRQMLQKATSLFYFKPVRHLGLETYEISLKSTQKRRGFHTVTVSFFSNRKMRHFF